MVLSNLFHPGALGQLQRFAYTWIAHTKLTGAAIGQVTQPSHLQQGHTAPAGSGGPDIQELKPD